MEDALVQNQEVKTGGLKRVLILVVMEDALARCLRCHFSGRYLCLNPCCNGRCTRTCIDMFGKVDTQVS